MNNERESVGKTIDAAERNMLQKAVTISGLLIFACGLFTNIPLFAGVNPDGSYSESMPIDIPAGRNGVQPKLALAYNSNSRNGIVGTGWSLQGIPIITRINYGRGINYDGQDTYTGSEGRLIDISPSLGQAAGSTYHAETEAWSKYEALGWDGNPLNGGNRCGDAACAWRVTDRSGIVSLYGDAGVSRIQAIYNSGAPISGGAIRVWALSRVTDLHGNYYEVEYYQNAGQYYPKKITYTLGGWASRYYAVTFDYDQSGRPDKDFGYDQSAFVQTNWRLQTINVTYRDSCLIFFTCSDPVRTYQLTYESTPGMSRISKINQYDSGNNNISELTLTWGNLGSGFTGGLWTSGGPWGWKDEDLLTTADVNGDGKADFIRLVGGNYPDKGNVQVTFGGPGGFTGGAWSSGGPWAWKHEDTINITDVNGDGKADFIRSVGGNYPDKGHVQVTFGGPGGFTGGSWSSGGPWGWAHEDTLTTTDVNGDGRADFIRHVGGNYPDKGHIQVTFGSPSGFTGGSWSSGGAWGWKNEDVITFADINGDGKSDFIRIVGGNYPDKGHIQVHFGGAGGFTGGFWTNGGPAGWPADDLLTFADVNGDGRADFIRVPGGNYPDKGHVQITFSGPGGLTGGSWSSGGAWGWKHEDIITFSDVNGDGKADFIRIVGGNYPDKGHVQIYFGGAAGFTGGFWTSGGPWGWPGEDLLTPTDVNGDGSEDLLRVPGGNYPDKGHVQVNRGIESRASLLVSIKNQNHVETVINYTRAGDVPNAVCLQTCIGPEGAPLTGFSGIPNAGPRYLVTSVTTTSDKDLDGNGTNDTFTTSYEYYNGRISTGAITERASLGFEKVKTIDVNSGNFKIDTYHQQKPFQTMLKETRSYIANGTLLSAQITGTPELWLCDESGCTLDPTNNPNPAQPKQLRQSGDMIAKQYINGVEALIERQSIVSADVYGNPLESQKVKQLGSEIYTEHAYATYINHAGDATHARAIGLPITTKKCVEDCSLFNTSEEKENFYDGMPSGEMGLRHLITSTKAKSGSVVLTRNLNYYDNGNLHVETNDTAAVKILTYDPDYEQYVRETRLTIPGKPDQISLQYVDVRYGVVTETVDLNGTKTQTELDAQGRIVGKRIKNSSGKLLSRSSYEYYLTGNSNPADHFAVECVHRKDGEIDNAFILKDCKYTYLDAMERKYLTIAPATNGITSGYTAIHTKYDNKNRVTHVSEPYFKADTTSVIGSPAFYSETIYDTYGRAWQQVASDNKITETNVYYSAGSNFVRTEIIGAGTVKESTTDARGLTRSVTEAKGTAVEGTITNTYYANGLLWQVSVPQGLTVLDYYPDTKQKKSIIDPNAGRTDYTYVTDIQSLSYGKILIETRPAPNGSGNITVTHSYSDPYGRLTKKLFSSGEEQLLTYDETDVAYGRNLLTTDEFKSQEYSYKRRHSYNELGQELQTTVDISHATESLCADIDAMPCHTRVENIFDELGRKKKIIYPDAKETVISYYGSSPNVSSIAHNGTIYASYDGYDNRAKPTGIHHGNGTRTTFSYIPETGLMDSLKTFDVQNRAIQDLSYTFNDRNNIEDLTDNVISGGSYHYEYDALNRVKQATRTDGKVFNYAFDEKGNLTLKENRTQVFNSGTTKLQYSDLTTQSGTIRTNFTWSAAGNLTRRSTNSEAINYAWSGENFLIESTRVGGNFNGTKMRNVYAGESNRFLRIYEQPGKQKVKTWNLGGVEFRETWSGSKRDDIQVTKYIYGIDGGRIASITGEPGQLVVSATSASQFRIAKFYGSQSVSGVIAKAPHLFMGCVYFIREAYASHRSIVLFSLLFFAVLLLVVSNRERRATFTFRDFSRRLLAFATVSSFAFANCTSGKNDPIFSNQAYSAVYGKIDELYRGLPAGTVFYHGNHLGSSTLISDTNGLEKIRIHYTTYGEIDQNLSGRWNPDTSTLVHEADQSKDAYLSVAYTGQSYSAEEEMYFYGARHYDATVGVFISADSIVPDAGTPMGYNRYMYVRGNPIKYTDPTGHSWWDDFTDWVEKAWEDTKAWVSKNAVAIAVTVVAIVVSVITAGAASGAMGAAASTFWGTVAVGAIAGAAGGFAAGATGAWLSGASFGDGLLAGFKGAAIGAITGAVMAGVGYGANKLFNKLFPGNGAGKATQSADQLDDGVSAADDAGGAVDNAAQNSDDLASSRNSSTAAKKDQIANSASDERTLVAQNGGAGNDGPLSQAKGRYTELSREARDSLATKTDLSATDVSAATRRINDLDRAVNITHRAERVRMYYGDLQGVVRRYQLEVSPELMRAW